MPNSDPKDRSIEYVLLIKELIKTDLERFTKRQDTYDSRIDVVFVSTSSAALYFLLSTQKDLEWISYSCIAIFVFVILFNQSIMVWLHFQHTRMIEVLNDAMVKIGFDRINGSDEFVEASTIIRHITLTFNKTIEKKKEIEENGPSIWKWIVKKNTLIQLFFWVIGVIGMIYFFLL